MSSEEVQQAYSDEWEAFHERKEDFRFPEGETGEEAQKRIADILEEKRKAHVGENIIFASHEGLIRLLMCHIMNIPVYQRGNFKVNTCGVTEIAYQSEYNTWRLIRFNQAMR